MVKKKKIQTNKNSKISDMKLAINTIHPLQFKKVNKLY